GISSPRRPHGHGSGTVRRIAGKRSICKGPGPRGGRTMSKIAFAELVREWEGLLAAVDDNRPELPGVERQREALESKLARVQELKATQNSARATKQRCTQLLREEIAEGKVMATQLRGLVRGNIDPRNEGLVQYGIAPLRKRSRRATPPARAEAGPAPP